LLKANIGLNASTSNQEESDATPAAIHPSWSAADERNVSIKMEWDNLLLHEEVFE
jgi:hypothetical protein